jgi:acyl-CoA reductase-like NAD-dependent aldehyde dehydrogenase
MGEDATLGSQEVARTPRVEMLVGGRHVSSATGEWFTVENPATQQALAQVPRGRSADVDRAVASATSAFPAWRDRSPSERGAALTRIADDISADVEELAQLLASETGNAIRTQSRPEILQAARTFQYFGGVSGELKGETVPLGSTLLSYTVREPYGVVGAVIPWNSPALLGSMKLAMAVVTGNTIVLKAAEDAPLTMLAIARICARHLPDGVVNVLTGYGVECGQPLLSHGGVAKISFTGSTAVGKLAMQLASDRVLPVTLELGGKSPTVIFPDRDDDVTAQGVLDAVRITRQSQSCTAGARLLVHESIFESFTARVGERLSSLRVGDPQDEATDIGSIINRRQYERVCGFLTDPQLADARALVGGAPTVQELAAPGYFVRPTVLTGVDPTWRVAREEVFGPVLVALPWSSEREVVAMANDTHYGLAAYVWGNDVAAALRTAHRIDAGWVQVNRGGGQLLGMSYGGRGESGLGQEFSIEGARDGYTFRKSITVDIGAPASAI